MTTPDQTRTLVEEAQHKHFRNSLEGGCFCGRDWPCSERMLANALEQSQREVERLKEQVYFGSAVNEAEGFKRGVEGAEVAVREACGPCGGTGVGRVFVSAGPDPYEEAEECEYCGRPIAAIRALLTLEKEADEVFALSLDDAISSAALNDDEDQGESDAEPE